jgi:hypothetical protein
MVPTPSKNDKAGRRKKKNEDSAMLATPTRAAAADSVVGVPGEVLAGRISLKTKGLNRLAIVAGDAYRENSDTFFKTTLKQIVEDKVSKGDVEQDSRESLLELCGLLGCNLKDTSTHVAAILIPNVIRNWRQQASVLASLALASGVDRYLAYTHTHAYTYMLCRSTTTQAHWTLERRCRT